MDFEPRVDSAGRVRRVTLVVSTLVMAAAPAGCSRNEPVSALPEDCPREISGVPNSDSTAPYLDWENDSYTQVGRPPYVVATIHHVAVTCFPVVFDEVEAKGRKMPSKVTYTIAASAHYRATVTDSLRYDRATRRSPVSGEMIFEAMGTGGTSIRAVVVDIELVKASGPLPSAKFEGIAGPEMERIAFVRARWKYVR